MQVRAADAREYFRVHMTALDLAVRFDAECRNARSAAVPHVATVAAVEKCFVKRPEIADIVAGEKRNSIRIEFFAFDIGQQREKIKQVKGVQ
jgi:hypothetical protein